MFRPPRPARSPGQFRDMNATQLFCPTCKRAMPVREKVALYLPTGVLYHYVCTQCDAVLGKKEDGDSSRLG
ncbi:MAG: cytoplasmic protein [Candidatus Wallbacteria bacterium]|nr:cytoplasmic protein [Candidatus Wallbacteria bacterium]